MPWAGRTSAIPHQRIRSVGARRAGLASVSNRRGGRTVNQKTLYERLGGYDAISAVVGDLLPRLRGDAQLGQFWQHRAEDSLQRSKQHLIDFLCSNAGGPVYYFGRDMKTSHKGMKISEPDWATFVGHLHATLKAFKLPQREHDELVALIQTTKKDMVEA
jgi:hemoglobin